MDELTIINQYFKPLANNKESFYLNDDTAKISLKKDEELIISKDLLAQDCHFLLKDGGYKIAKKALLSNLSDIASSGAKPYGYMLGFSKNDKLDEKFYASFSQGLKEVQDEYKIKLLGGDTIKSKNLVFSITIFAKTKKNQHLLRQNAKDHELIYISGTIGDSFLGLNNKNNQYFHDRHFFPTPRIKLGQELLKNNLSKCATDISDGLLSDINHICNSAKLNAKINLDKIPFSAEATNHLQSNKKITKLDLISAGEDYELIFSINKKDQKKVEKLSKKLKLKLTNIGHFYKNNSSKFEAELLDSKNQKIKIKNYGYSH